MADQELPTSYKCVCGEEHKFPAYVFAHWDEELAHTCGKCGARHRIVQGKATQIIPKYRGAR